MMRLPKRRKTSTKRPTAQQSQWRSFLRLLTAITALSLVLAACGSSVEPDERGTTMTYSYPQEPPNWDYLETGLTAVSGPLLENVWETLVRLEADGTPVAVLAESWDVNGDTTVFTLNIREDVKFHDGSDMTSADVVYSLNKAKESGVSRAAAPLAESRPSRQSMTTPSR